MTISEKICIFTFLTIIIVVYVLEISFVLVFLTNKLGAKPAANILLCKPALLVHLLGVIVLISLLYGYFIEPYWIEVKTIPIQTDKLTETSFRLVHISDLHCDKKPRNEKKLVELINAMKPDIIVFTGDSLNSRAALPLFKETMKNLKANLAKFAVYGNYDYWYRPRPDCFGGTGFELLDANSIKVQKGNETLYISGLGCEHPGAFRDVLKNVPKNHFSIFLYHYPGLVEDLKDLNVDLYLAGHTHGGQVALPLYGALITLSKFGKKYESGMYTVGNTILYVNRGIGMGGGPAPRVRFLARPEITVFDIKPKK